MRIVLWIVGTPVALAVIAFVVGSLLPRDHRAASSLRLATPLATAWDVVRDLGALPSWWPDITAMSRDESARDGETWVQQSRFGASRLTVVAEEPGRSLVTELDAGPKAAFGGRWTYALESSAIGTTITVTEDGWVGNPLFRVMMHLGGTHRTVDGYLRALARRFGSDAEPVHMVR